MRQLRQSGYESRRTHLKVTFTDILVFFQLAGWWLWFIDRLCVLISRWAMPEVRTVFARTYVHSNSVTARNWQSKAIFFQVNPEALIRGILKMKNTVAVGQIVFFLLLDCSSFFLANLPLVCCHAWIKQGNFYVVQYEEDFDYSHWLLQCVVRQTVLTFQADQPEVSTMQ